MAVAKPTGGRWVTIRGARVFIGESGLVEKGPATLLAPGASSWQPSMSREEADRWSEGGAFAGVAFYHGTSEAAAARIRESGFAVGVAAQGRAGGEGVYGSTSRSYAAEYGTPLELRTNVRNPARMTPTEVNALARSPATGRLADQLDEAARAASGKNPEEWILESPGRTTWVGKAMTSQLRDRGHDALVIEPPDGSKRILIAFDPRSVVVVRAKKDRK